MPSAFSIFVDLKAETRDFTGPVRDAEARLQGLKGTMDQTEVKAKSLGQTTAVAGRQYEKFNDSISQNLVKMRASWEAYQRGEISAKQMASSLAIVDRATANLNSKLSDHQARLTDLASRQSDVIANLKRVVPGMQQFGQTLAIGVTAPLIALGYASVNSAMGIDAMRNRLVAATGSLDAANKKMTELRQLAQGSAGVFTSSAVELYAFLRPLQVGEETINTMIKALGRLKLANEELDPKRFAINLTQLFTQNFERMDLKEAVGAFPRFGEIMQKAFQLSGSDLDTVAEEMKTKLKAGMTKAKFFEAIAEAIENDPSLSKLGDTIGIRFQKMMERVLVALEPLGSAVLNILEPIAASLTPLIQRLSVAFTNLSPGVQTAIVVFGGLAVAAGPLVLGLASIISAVTAIAGAVAALGGLSTILPVIAGVAAGLTALAAAGAALYAGWKSDFGGIRTLTIETWMAVMPYVKTAWASISELFRSGITQIRNVTQLGLAVMRGDWQTAWADILNIIEEGTRFGIKTFQTFADGVKSVLGNILPILAEWGVRFAIALEAWIRKGVTSAIYIFLTLPQRLIETVPVLVQAGVSVGQAIMRGIRQGLSGGLIGGELEDSGGIGGINDLIKSFQGRPSGSASGELSLGGGSGSLPIFDKITKGSKAAKDSVKDLNVSVDSLLTAMRVATAGQENNGKNGPSNARTGAMGMFQILPGNIAEWTRETFGEAMSPEKFKASTAAQIAVFNKYMGGYLTTALRETAGEWKTAVRMAAAAWYGGKGNMNNYAGNFGGKGKEPTFNEYTSSVLKRVTASLGKGSAEFDSSELLNILTKADDGVKGLTKSWAEYIDTFKPLPTETEKWTAAIKDPKVWQAFEEIGKRMKISAVDAANWARAIAMVKDVANLDTSFTGEGSGRKTDGTTGSLGELPEDSPLNLAYPSKLTLPWEKFWATMRDSITHLKSQLIPLKQAIGENLLDSLGRVGDIFANAIQNSDGTFKGFLKSVGQGFKQLVSQILSDFARLAVNRLLTMLLGGLLGGIGGGGAVASAAGHSMGPAAHFAAGGVPTVGQPSIVGEHGPELFIPGVSGRVLSHPDSMRALSGSSEGRGGSPIIVNNHFHADRQTGAFSKASASQAASEMVAFLERHQQRNR